MNDEPQLLDQYGEPIAEKEMTFIDHLEELRWHIIRSVLAAIVFAVVAFLNARFLFETVLFGPTRSEFWTYRQLCRLGEALNTPGLCVQNLKINFLNRSVGGQFTMHLTSSLIMGLVCAFPYLFWEVWRFVSPGLHKRERRATTGAVFFVTLLFALGLLFGYYILAPLSINFLFNYQMYAGVGQQVQNFPDLDGYLGLIIPLVLACGILFQLPMVAYVLAKIGIISAPFLRTFRRHAIVVILIVSAVITPSADVLSQVLVALPLILLYELSIGIVGSIDRKRAKEEPL